LICGSATASARPPIRQRNGAPSEHHELAASTPGRLPVLGLPHNDQRLPFSAVVPVNGPFAGTSRSTVPSKSVSTGNQTGSQLQPSYMDPARWDRSGLQLVRVRRRCPSRRSRVSAAACTHRPSWSKPQDAPSSGDEVAAPVRYDP
jgi:hypothetical protein